jgi:HK97 gp10 family phage protein
MTTVQGWDKLQKQFGQIADMDWVSAEVDAMNVIAKEAKVLVPVDTGALQITIGVEVEGETVSLVAGGGEVDYALHVEFGTIKMAAQPYMRPAIDTKGNEAVKAAGKNLETQMKRIANG